MAIVIALIVIALAGFAAYAYLRASGIATGGEERLAIVFGFALALVLRPESPAELVAELVAMGIIVLGFASIAHLAAVTFRDRDQQVRLASWTWRGPSRVRRRPRPSLRGRSTQSTVR